MRKLSVLALLFVLPFGGMRMICADAPSTAHDPEKTAFATQTTQDADCERICALHKPGDSGNEHCSLTGGDSALVMAIGVGGMTANHAVAPAPATADHAYLEFTPIYLEPALTLQSPPPKVLSL